LVSVTAFLLEMQSNLHALLYADLRLGQIRRGVGFVAKADREPHLVVTREWAIRAIHGQIIRAPRGYAPVRSLHPGAPVL